MELKDNQIVLYVLPPDDNIAFQTYGNKDYAYLVAILPRGYRLERDKKGEPYISCPGGAKVYDFRHTRRNAEHPAFDYDFRGKKRRIYLKIDYETTHEMIAEELREYSESLNNRPKRHGGDES